ncbi:hypothetical protein AAG570_012432 [Ranatra chinensis]|uniref:Uncharacterized protein n=1 Tax=Ranatra chinensis TaxID=642074 RepID=A0ABD0YSI8_9HEMI
MVLGTDLLRPSECYVRCKKSNWRVKLGKKSYRVFETIEPVGETQINVASVKVKEIKFKGLFDEIAYKEGEKLQSTKRVKHSIELIDNRPVYSKPRRYPVAFREIIREHIKEMLNMGVIRESVSTFNSPLWVVPKKLDKSGVQKYRVVVDYRELNKRTKTEKYPLPRLEEMLDRMVGSEVFSVIDLKSGYHQIPMEPGDIEKTAFQFERGNYEFVRMPFGLKNAPITFQRMIDDLLLGLDESFVQAYMDDLIIFSKTEIEHIKHLEKVKNRLKEFGLRISSDKSYLGLEEVKFMGHIVSRQGTRPDPNKVKAIEELVEPKNLKELRSFLGMINFYRRFIHNLADKIEPLTKLLKKNRSFEMDELAREAFKWGKEALATVPILQFPNFEKKFILTTDASKLALGAVLAQEEELEEKPIAFASKKLTPTQTSQNLHEILHTKGKENVVADCLSRQINAIEDVDEEYANQFLREWIGDSETISEAESGDPWGFDEVQGDIWYWEGMKVLTMLDVATRFLFTKCVTRKTGEAIKEGILDFCGTVGIPKKLVTDSGTDFQNKKVNGLLKELKIPNHITTPGHTHSHGAIERVHSTLAEHMRLLEIGKGVKGPEAVSRATLAYNNSIHSATASTPLELMRIGKRLDRGLSVDIDMEAIRDRIKANKMKRIEQINDKRKYRKPWGDRYFYQQHTWVSPLPPFETTLPGSETTLPPPPSLRHPSPTDLAHFLRVVSKSTSHVTRQA